MLKKCNKLFSLIVAMVVMSVAVFSMNVIAEDGSSDTGNVGENLVENVDIVPFETLSKEERDSRVEKLIKTLYSGDATTIRSISVQFTSNTYENLSRYRNSGGLGSGVITKMVVDYIEVPNSNDGDFVAMVNLKVNRGAADYLYLLEFHYNYSGVIYGYNIWEY